CYRAHSFVSTYRVAKIDNIIRQPTRLGNECLKFLLFVERTQQSEWVSPTNRPYIEAVFDFLNYVVNAKISGVLPFDDSAESVSAVDGVVNDVEITQPKPEIVLMLFLGLRRSFDGFLRFSAGHQKYYR